MHKIHYRKNTRDCI